MHGVDEVNNAVIRTPPHSPIMAHAWQVCQAKEPSQLKWGETGPYLLQEAVRTFRLQGYVQPHAVFSPYGWQDWEIALDPDVAWEFDKKTYAVHLWNEMWRRAGFNKNRSYSPDCLYEQLKSRYLHQ
jgi:hypothetical protein